MRGIVRQRSRSYTVSGPSASDNVENSGLSARYEPWQARWARRPAPEPRRSNVRPVAASPTNNVGRREVQRGQRLDLGGRRWELRSGGEQDTPPGGRRPPRRPPIRRATGETETGRPASPGSAATRSPCRAPVGTTTTARSDRRGTRPGTQAAPSTTGHQVDEGRPRGHLGRRRALGRVQPVQGEGARTRRPRHKSRRVGPSSCSWARPAGDRHGVEARRRRPCTRAACDRRAVGDGVADAGRPSDPSPPATWARRVWSRILPLPARPVRRRRSPVAGQHVHRCRRPADPPSTTRRSCEEPGASTSSLGGVAPGHELSHHPAGRFDPGEQLPRPAVRDGRP